MAEQFNIGDTVELKSGGPLMTITGQEKGNKGNQQVMCTWFDREQNMKTGVFPVQAIQECTPRRWGPGPRGRGRPEWMRR